MATILNAVSGTGLTQTADASGVMKVQSNGVTTNALAWVNFNGTLTGTITPRANYNIGSVTKNATGDYTLNFTSALTDANYSVVAMAGTGGASTNTVAMGPFTSAPTTTAFRFMVTNINTALVDAAYVSAVVFGN